MSTRAPSSECPLGFQAIMCAKKAIVAIFNLLLLPRVVVGTISWHLGSPTQDCNEVCSRVSTSTTPLYCDPTSMTAVRSAGQAISVARLVGLSPTTTDSDFVNYTPFFNNVSLAVEFFRSGASTCAGRDLTGNSRRICACSTIPTPTSISWQLALPLYDCNRHCSMVSPSSSHLFCDSAPMSAVRSSEAVFRVAIAARASFDGADSNEHPAGPFRRVIPSGRVEVEYFRNSATSRCDATVSESYRRICACTPTPTPTSILW